MFLNAIGRKLILFLRCEIIDRVCELTSGGGNNIISMKTECCSKQQNEKFVKKPIVIHKEDANEITDY